LKKIACVILAGGESERFGGDKLLTKYKGEEIIKRVCKAAKPCVDDLYISARTRERAEQLATVLNNLIDGYLVDTYSGCQGPLRGMATATELGHEYILTLSADLPEIKTETLAVFLQKLVDKEYSGGSIVWGNGAVETLIQLHKTEELRAIFPKLCQARGEVARPSDLLRASASVLLIHGRELTDDPRVFANVNRPEDLMSLEPRAPLEGWVKEDIHLGPWHSELFWRATAGLSGERLEEAEANYLAEAEGYLKMGLTHLAGHALMDAGVAAERMGDMGRAENYRRRSREILSRMSYEFG